ILYQRQLILDHENKFLIECKYVINFFMNNYKKYLILFAVLTNICSNVEAAIIVDRPGQDDNLISVETQQLSWQEMRDNTLPTDDSIIAAQSLSGPLYICQAEEKGGIHPGVVHDNTCVVTYGGKIIAHRLYKILTGKTENTEWRDFSFLWGNFSRGLYGVE